MIIKANSLYIPLKDQSVHCVVTSPPYFGLRKYQIPDSIWDGDEGCDHQWGRLLPSHHPGQVLQQKDGPNKQGAAARGQTSPSGQFCLLCSAWRGQLGLEPTIDLYVSHLVQIFREVRRVLRSDGTLWLNLGDSYASGKGSCYNPGGGERSLGKHLKNAGVYYLERSNISDLREQGLKPKDLCEIPSEVVRALRADGWWLRNRIPWIKKNPMPGSVEDRPVNNVEYVFLLSKSRTYYYDSESTKIAMAEYERQRRLREYEQGLTSTYPLQRDNQTGFANLGKTSICRDVKVRQKQALTGIRNRRDGDWFLESFSGLLQDDEGSPVAFILNIQPFGGEQCQNCETIYSPGPYHRLQEYKEVINGQEQSNRICKACGRWDSWLSHFATFNQELIEPMIKASTSEKGCCPKCGAPWVRMVQKERIREAAPSGNSEIGRWSRKDQGAVGGRMTETKTLGWEPSCPCDAGDPVPCVVLDPFSGSGTTPRASEKLRRRAIGLDLGYHGLSQHRTKNVQRELML